MSSRYLLNSHFYSTYSFGWDTKTQIPFVEMISLDLANVVGDLLGKRNLRIVGDWKIGEIDAGDNRASKNATQMTKHNTSVVSRRLSVRPWYAQLTS